jgi:hypothetical protein
LQHLAGGGADGIEMRLRIYDSIACSSTYRGKSRIAASVWRVRYRSGDTSAGPPPLQPRSTRHLALKSRGSSLVAQVSWLKFRARGS